ncbi:hypothetical protein CDD80_2351 [Ophiocordyceps camponoti-rufipedis]|uniref:DUF6598 domain-containing protein n=1 Tax=Ophiocordyceps camponoti-rufipedis TaxID=2004952 RepID=A0A2C5Z8I2_9HYPO|nr:hypothetical protein CDD80_2351 [Ophiocordyceps camponoti-rufipedis]
MRKELAQYAKDKGQGRPLAWVNSITIDNIDGESPGNLFGKVTARDRYGDIVLYDKPSSEAENITPGDYIPGLNLTARVIEASQPFSVELDLLDWDRISPNDQISKGGFEWQPSQGYDMIKETPVSGPNGLATVRWTVLQNARSATISVFLIKGGDVDAWGDGSFSTDGRSRIFYYRESNNYAKIPTSDQIPFAEAKVPVIVGSTLRVHIKLSAFTSSGKDEVVSGSLTFNATTRNWWDKQTIKGVNGDVRVDFTWD